MTFEEIDNYVGDLLKDKYGKDSERRDYREIEKKDPVRFKGYGEKSGLMYLVDVDGDHYIDINIWPDSTRMVFRGDDDSILHLIKKNEIHKDSLKNYIDSFISLVDEYGIVNSQMYSRFNEFNKGNIPVDLKRNNKIKEIIS